MSGVKRAFDPDVKKVDPRSKEQVAIERLLSGMLMRRMTGGQPDVPRFSPPGGDIWSQLYTGDMSRSFLQPVEQPQSMFPYMLLGLLGSQLFTLPQEPGQPKDPVGHGPPTAPQKPVGHEPPPPPADTKPSEPSGEKPVQRAEPPVQASDVKPSIPEPVVVTFQPPQGPMRPEPREVNPFPVFPLGMFTEPDAVSSGSRMIGSMTSPYGGSRFNPNILRPL